MEGLRVSSLVLALLFVALVMIVTMGEAAATTTATGHHHHRGGKSGKATSKPTTEAKNNHSGGSASSASDRRVRKRSKWIQQQQQSTSSSSASSISSKDGSFLKRIVAEVIAERDAQIAAALFEVAKNQPHLQMMVQTLGELSQSNQRLELSSTRLDETQRRLDSRLGVISEKMTLLESRLGQTERRIEREMTHIHGKMDEVFRNMPDKPTDSLVRNVKQIQDHLNIIEEVMLERMAGPPTHNQIRSSSGNKNRHHHHKSGHHGVSNAELQKLGNSLSQAIAAVHLDLGRALREAESNLDHQLSMLATDNGVFSCAISRLMDRLALPTADAGSVAEELLLMSPLVLDGAGESNVTRQLLEGNSIQTVDLSGQEQLMTSSNMTHHHSPKCVLKCP